MSQIAVMTIENASQNMSEISSTSECRMREVGIRANSSPVESES